MYLNVIFVPSIFTDSNCLFEEKQLITLGEGVPLRLTGGSDENRGRLEAYIQNDWEAVCAATVNAAMAGVICRAMQIGWLIQFSSKTPH